MSTGIPYVDETWNVTVGCTRVSPGCDNCWACDYYHRFRNGLGLMSVVVDCDWTGTIDLRNWELEKPLHWKRPRRILVNATSDLFHDNVPTEYLKEVFAIVQQCPQHTFLSLTKRPRRAAAARIKECTKHLENWWPGVSIENQATANLRIPILCSIPAAHRWISIEPLLGPILLPSTIRGKIDWVIIGCESGSNRRYCNIEWVRSIASQCRCLFGIPVYIKQLAINGKCNRNIEEWPTDAQIQNVPNRSR